MTDNSPVGTEWTPTEINMVISEYFAMLKSELGKSSYVKVHHNERVRAVTGRSKGSVEYKFQNISAVLQLLGMPWIDGYKPMANFQRALLIGIETYLSQTQDIFSIFSPKEAQGFSQASLYLEPPPLLVQGDDVTQVEELDRLARKFDPAARDERNRNLGKRGEELVLQFERFNLNQTRPDLAKKIRWVSVEDGDGAGYDILSFDTKGEERLIEVKTTIGYHKTPFYISSNELALSNERPDRFRLIRVFDFLKTPKAFELTPPLTHSVILTPQNYRASFQ